MPDGTFDLETLKAELKSSTDPARTKVRTDRQGTQPSVTTEDDARAAVSLVRQVLQEEGAYSSGTIDFEMARTAETILRATSGN